MRFSRSPCSLSGRFSYPAPSLSLLLLLALSQTLSANAANFEYLPQAEVKLLQVAQQTSTALVRPWLGKKRLGVAVIVPSLGLNPDAPGLVSLLRHRLNNAGWATIAVTPPTQVAMPNFATGPKEIAKAGEGQLQQKRDKPTPKFTAEEQEQHQDDRLAFLSATMDQLDELGRPFPGKRLLIAMDESAGMVISLLSQNKLPAPDILVAINPFMSTEADNQGLPSQLAQLSTPVLDIQSSDGQAASLATRELRHSLSPSNAPYRYSQEMLALTLRNESAWLTSLKLIESFAHRIDKAYPRG